MCDGSKSYLVKCEFLYGIQTDSVPDCFGPGTEMVT